MSASDLRPADFDDREVRDARDERDGSGGPVASDSREARAARLREERAEIAREPGGHGRFALACSIAVVVLLTAFFVVRVWVLR